MPYESLPSFGGTPDGGIPQVPLYGISARILPGGAVQGAGADVVWIEPGSNAPIPDYLLSRPTDRQLGAGQGMADCVPTGLGMAVNQLPHVSNVEMVAGVEAARRFSEEQQRLAEAYRLRLAEAARNTAADRFFDPRARDIVDRAREQARVNALKSHARRTNKNRSRYSSDDATGMAGCVPGTGLAGMDNAQSDLAAFQAAHQAYYADQSSFVGQDEAAAAAAAQRAFFDASWAPYSTPDPAAVVGYSLPDMLSSSTATNVPGSDGSSYYASVMPTPEQTLMNKIPDPSPPASIWSQPAGSEQSAYAPGFAPGTLISEVKDSDLFAPPVSFQAPGSTVVRIFPTPSGQAVIYKDDDDRVTWEVQGPGGTSSLRYANSEDEAVAAAQRHAGISPAPIYTPPSSSSSGSMASNTPGSAPAPQQVQSPAPQQQAPIPRPSPMSSGTPGTSSYPSAFQQPSSGPTPAQIQAATGLLATTGMTIANSIPGSQSALQRALAQRPKPVATRTQPGMSTGAKVAIGLSVLGAVGLAIKASGSGRSSPSTTPVPA